MQNYNIDIQDHKIIPPLSNLKPATNKIKTTMYTIFTFLPHSLYNQLKQFTNIYFIFLSILSWFPIISTLNPYSVFVAVLFILVFSMSFDWAQDLKRYLSDKKVNNKKVKILRDGRILFLKAKEVLIGDMLFMEEGDGAMADCVLLSYKNKVGYCYIDTSTLDGEKTLKPKISAFESNLNFKCFLKNDSENLVINKQDNKIPNEEEFFTEVQKKKLKNEKKKKKN